MCGSCFAFESQIYRLFNGRFCGWFITIIDFNHYFCGHSIKKQYSKSKSRSIHRTFHNQVFVVAIVCTFIFVQRGGFKSEIFFPSSNISAGNIGSSVEYLLYLRRSFLSFLSFLSFCRFIALFNLWNLWIAGSFVEFFNFIYFKYMQELCVNWCLYLQWINIHETRKYWPQTTKINGSTLNGQTWRMTWSFAHYFHHFIKFYSSLNGQNGEPSMVREPPSRLESNLINFGLRQLTLETVCGIWPILSNK